MNLQADRSEQACHSLAQRDVIVDYAYNRLLLDVLTPSLWIQTRDQRSQKSRELFDYFVVSRQPELEHGTIRYVRQSPELPAVRLNDRSADC